MARSDHRPKPQPRSHLIFGCFYSYKLLHLAFLTQEEHILIEVKNLTKKYGSNTVLKGLNFTIESGKIYGFLGPNGAGKSTTMNILTGCLAPTDGAVLINGHDILEEPLPAKKSIGYLPEQPPLYQDMTPWEYLTFVAEAKGVKSSDIAYQVEDVMRRTNITSMQDRLIKHLSKGYKQRVGIAQALLGKPDVIILDEPTVGLDPKQITEIRDLIIELGTDHTVILSSHILSEISAVCDHVMIISAGELVASDTLDNIRRNYVTENLINITAKCSFDKLSEILTSINGVIRFEAMLLPGDEEINDVKIEIEENLDLRETIFKAFADAKVALLRLTDSSISLEEVFLKLTEIKADETNEDDDFEEYESDEDYEEDTDYDDNNNDDNDDEDGDDDYTPLFKSNN